ncbi:MAG: Crp/Fnr family transcriptional regulator [Bacteroidota bacterium]
MTILLAKNLEFQIFEKRSHRYVAGSSLQAEGKPMEAFNLYLKQFPHYSTTVFEEVLPFLSSRNLEAGEYFLRGGTTCKEIGFVEKGMLRLFYLNDGKEITNCFCKENTLTTSYSSLITQKESDLTIQAIEPSTLIVFSHHALQQLYEKNLFWQQLGRLAAENELMATECHHRFLHDLPATERYQQILEEDPELLQRVPLNYLATYLQIAPETLSRIRRKISRT